MSSSSIPALMSLPARAAPQQRRQAPYNSHPRRTFPPPVDHLSKHMHLGLKMIHHLHRIGTDRETSRLPISFQKMSTSITRSFRPARPNGALTKKFQQATTEYLQEITHLMRDHYKDLLVKTSQELQRLHPSNTGLQKAAQVALSWHRHATHTKIQPSTVHTYRVWSREYQSVSTTQSLDAHLFSRHPARQPTRRPEPAAIPTTNRFQALAEEDPDPIEAQDTCPPTTTPASSLPQESINVQGQKNPMSNFYLTPITHRGELFPSVEHAYQHQKAIFMDHPSLAHDIIQARSASRAKALSKQLDNHPKTTQWNQQKEALMSDLLRTKANQCRLFREKLLATGQQKLTHKVPHPFWGTTCRTSQGTLILGRDKFATLLMTLRDELRAPTPPRETTSSSQPRTYAEVTRIPGTPKRPRHSSESSDSSLPTILPPRTPAKRRRRAPASETTSPIQTPPATPPPSETRPTPPELRQSFEEFLNTFQATPQDIAQYEQSNPSPPQPEEASQQTEASQEPQPETTYHKPILLIGDSNLNRIQNPPDDIQIDSYPGSTITSLHKKHLNSGQPSHTPRTVIVSIGINNQQYISPTHCTQELKKLCDRLTSMFPRAKIYIPRLNYTRTFESYKTINHCLQTPPRPLRTIPAIATHLFKTTADGHHWTPTTATRMINHWRKFLSSPTLHS